MADTVRVLRIEVKAEELQLAKKRVGDLTAEIKDLSKAEGDNRKAIAQKTIELQKEKEKIKELQYEQKQRIILTRNEETSVNSLRAQLALNTQALNKMSDAERNSTEEGKKLVAESKRLTDELKKQEKAIGDTRRNVGNYDEGIGKIGASLKQWGVAALGAVGAMEVFNKAITVSDALGDAWTKTMNAANAAITVFFNAIANGDWSNLIWRMGEAIDAAKEFSEEMDAIEDRRIGRDIKSAKDRIILEDLLLKMRNKSKYTEEQRLAFAEQYDEIVNSALRDNLALEQKAFEANSKRLAATVGLTQNQVEVFTRLFDVNEKNVDAAGNYLKLLKDLKDAQSELTAASGRRGATLAPYEAQVEAIEKQISAIQKSNPQLVRFALQYQKIFSAPEMWKETYEAYLSTLDLQEKALQEKSKSQKVRVSLEMKEEKDLRAQESAAAAAAKKEQEEEAKRLAALAQEKIKAEQEFLKAKQSTEDEIYLLTLDAYNKELVQTMQFYDNMIAAAEKYGLDTEELKKKQEEAITAIVESENVKRQEANKKTTESQTKLEEEAFKNKMQIASATADLLQNMSQLARQGSIAQKVLATGSAIISTYQSAAAALAPPPTGAGPLLGPLLAASAIAQGLASVAKINAVQFATGGKVGASNIPQQSNGDNVLATVKTGEVVLNERQQKLLGGAPTFRKIGVPGFAGGGRVAGASIPARLERATAQEQKSIKVIQVQRDFEKSQREFKVAQTQGDF